MNIPRSMNMTKVAGWLKKNHAGASFKEEGARKRFFICDRFHVRYYADEKQKHLKGHFDLRNVVSIAPRPEEHAEDAICIRIAERTPGNVRKTMIISFTNDPAARPRWLVAWCSAVAKENVAPELHLFINDEITNKVKAEWASQHGIGSKRNLLSSEVPEVAPLGAKDDVLYTSVAQESASHAALDTPKDGANAMGNQDQATATYEVTVPAHACEGDKLRMRLPIGVEAVVTVPAGASAGSILTFRLPASAMQGRTTEPEAARKGIGHDEKAAVLIQAHVRGLHARHEVRTQQQASKATGAAAPSYAVEAAAVVIQSARRGVKAREKVESIKAEQKAADVDDDDASSYSRCLLS